MAISDFRKLWALTPQKQNFDFFQKINAKKKTKKCRYSKTGICIIEISVTNMCTKFQANIFIFCCTMTKKPSNGNDAIFLNSIFGISHYRTTKQVHFWKPETKLDKIGMLLKENLDLQNLTFFT